LDFETNPSFGLIVRVTDTSALFDTGTITINLADFVEPPADFNRDGHMDCQDVDALVVEIVSGSNSAAFDLTNDGVVNRDDLASWLEQAGAANLASGNAYLPGDANLDGVVDGVDFGIWQENRFTSVASWCAGDFNADSFVDVADFNIWNDHRFMSALEMPAAAAANEPPTDAPRAPLAVQHLATHDLALPISAQVIRARSTSTINGNDATSDGWPQVDHDGVLFTGRDSRERQLDTLFAQIGRTRAVPKVSSAGILDSFWKELFVDLSFISQFRDEVINQRA
jgi:hypothetical protein